MEFPFYEGEASAGGVGVRGSQATFGRPDYPGFGGVGVLQVRLRRTSPFYADRGKPCPYKKRKKSLSIREVEEVREVRDDRPACSLIQLSQDKVFRLRSA